MLTHQLPHANNLRSFYVELYAITNLEKYIEAEKMQEGMGNGKKVINKKKVFLALKFKYIELVFEMPYNIP